MPDKTLTVQELIELLKNFDPNTLVYTEGCDCIGCASGVKLEADGSILILRNN